MKPEAESYVRELHDRIEQLAAGLASGPRS